MFELIHFLSLRFLILNVVFFCTSFQWSFVRRRATSILLCINRYGFLGWTLGYILALGWGLFTSAAFGPEANIPRSILINLTTGCLLLC
jgi:hypothetical protein